MEADASGRRPVEPAARVERGRLAGAIGAYKTRDASHRRLEAEIVHRDETAEANGELFNRQSRDTARNLGRWTIQQLSRRDTAGRRLNRHPGTTPSDSIEERLELD